MYNGSIKMIKLQISNGDYLKEYQLKEIHFPCVNGLVKIHQKSGPVILQLKKGNICLFGNDENTEISIHSGFAIIEKCSNEKVLKCQCFFF